MPNQKNQFLKLTERDLLDIQEWQHEVSSIEDLGCRLRRHQVLL